MGAMVLLEMATLANGARMKHDRGFSLIEIAIVMVIVALLLASSVALVAGMQRSQKEKENAAILAAATDALLGFATTQTPPHFPCPNVNGDGLEGLRTPPNAGPCTSFEGWLPSAALGVAATDAYGNRIRYRVDPNFSSVTAGTLLLTTTAGLRVCDSQPAGAAACTRFFAQNVPAVLVSHGQNGLGARNNGFVLNAAPTGADELANVDGRDATDGADTACPIACTFVSHEPREAGAATGEFDDSVAWVSAATLFNRLVAAGRLP